MIHDEEIELLEAELELPTKKSRQKPSISLDEIAKEVEGELGHIVLNNRQQPNMDVKKVFCFVAIELGHHPTETGKRCGIRRIAAYHHWKSMKRVILLAGVAQKLSRQ